MSKKLIVIEGLDGSGKSTQFELLQSQLAEAGHEVIAISFPDYAEPSSELVKMYLNGEFGDKPGDVNAYAASSFYAVDRYASYKKYWQQGYESGTLTLASRYTTSNAIYQMVKMEKSEWDSYLDWLEDFEYGRMGLPVPDVVVFIDMPVEVSQKLLMNRYDGDEGKRDLHERNIDFLHFCREAALYAAKRLGWHTLEASDGQNPLPVKEINEHLRLIIKEAIADIC